MVLVKLLFDDGSTKVLKPHSERDFDGIELYINSHPEILHVELITQDEVKQHEKR